jgi:hypothetical protein
MPFKANFDRFYSTVMKPTVESCGLTSMRADEFWKNEILMKDIFDLIFHSSVVIADLSERNPNVAYELGICHTMGIQVVPIVQDSSDIPFDLRQHRYLQYSIDSKSQDDFVRTLTNRLTEIMAAIDGN